MDYLTNTLASAFADKAIVDDRQPVLTFQLPAFVSDGGEFGLYAPRAEPWKQMALISIGTAALQVAFAAVMYALIVRRYRGTYFSYVLGWGVLIPLSALVTFAFLECADIYNRFVALSAGTLSTGVFFRCVESMYGCSGKYVEESFANYASYCSTLCPLEWDDKTRTVRTPGPGEVAKLALEVAAYFFAASALVSIAASTGHEPFAKTGIDFAGFEIDAEMFAAANIANSYFRVWLTYCTYKLGFELTGLGEQLKGLSTLRIFNDPLTKSRTPTEFWTKRWNMMHHNLLKRGTFAPARKFFSKGFSIFLTFLVSGLYHEFCWRVMFYDVSSKDCDGPEGSGRQDLCYDPVFGRVTTFFAVASAFMLLERPVSRLPAVAWLSERLPTIAVASLIVLIHTPFQLWHGGDWILGGYFDHVSIALFRIRRL